MTEPFTQLQDITDYTVHYKPANSTVAFRDCPKVVRDAANGQPPPAKYVALKDILREGWGILLVTILVINTVIQPIGQGHGFTYGFVTHLLATLIPLIWIPFYVARYSRNDYAKDKELFDAYAANPELFRDEIFKAAVARLQCVDFHGKHLPAQDGAKVGHLEADVIEGLRKLGIRQETTVANRGRPYLIHQYELTELKWGTWQDGGTKNYVMDIAILWPERRIKFDIEVDDPSHKTGTRPLKDRNRDEMLTERGWFTRRLNHKFLADPVKTANALKDVVGIVYFFAKYANDEPIDWEFKMGARMQNRRFRTQDKAQWAQKTVQKAGKSSGSVT